MTFGKLEIDIWQLKCLHVQTNIIDIIYVQRTGSLRALFSTHHYTAEAQMTSHMFSDQQHEMMLNHDVAKQIHS
jgi:hypothetical protein